MHLYNYNEMFILALVALSIVGVIGLGLLTVLAIFVLGRKREKVQQGNTLSSAINSSPATPTEPILDKLNYLLKEQRKSSPLSKAAFGFAVTAFSTNTAVTTSDSPTRILTSILAFISLLWFIYYFGLWVRFNREK